jgi:type IV pilus biogenesis protein CpaD/CtpE
LSPNKVKTIMNVRPLVTVAAMAAALPFCGCVDDAPDLRDIAAPRLEVVSQSHLYRLPKTQCSGKSAAVQRFLAAAAQDRPESVRVTIEGASSACLGQLGRDIERSGIERSHIHLLVSPGRAGVTLRTQRLVVAGADCYISAAANDTQFSGNQFDPALGCGLLVNLGEMVADPNDLFLGHGTNFGEGEPAATAVAVERHALDKGPSPPAASPAVNSITPQMPPP